MSTSTSSEDSSTISTMNSPTDMMMGVFWVLIASVNHRPTPGHWKMFSMTMAPLIRVGRRKPISTITGVQATRKPWNMFTFHSGRPLARAVLT